MIGGGGLGSWSRSCGCGIPGLLGGETSGEPLVGALGVVDAVEVIDLGLEFLEGYGPAAACPAIGTVSGGIVHSCPASVGGTACL